MILRKPYAFLIKNFKLIHLIITILLTYVIFKTSDILKYLNGLTSEEVSKNIATNYISFWPILAIIFAILIMVIVYLLMSYKKKPKFIYLASIIGYIVVIVILFVTYFYFESFAYELISQKVLRIYRDLFIMLMGFQYIIVAVMLVRALGFNIKKFDFVKDLQDLNIDVTDNEEVELSVGLDTNKVMRKARRKRREFIYYIKENKLFVLLFLGVILLIGGIYLILNISVFNKVYSYNEKIKTSNYIIQIEKSYVTTKKYNNTIIDDSSSYVVVKFNISSILDESQTLNLDHFVLKIGNKKYSANKKYYDYFTDLGIGYTSQNIEYNKVGNYILVFKVDQKYHNKKMHVSYEYNNGKDLEIRLIKLDNINLDKVSSTKNYKINSEINFKNSILKNSTFKITKYELEDSFTYTYKYCSNSKNCIDIDNSITKTNDDTIALLKLDVTSSYDKTITIDNINLINYYGTIKYNLDGKTYISKLNNRTNNLVNQYIFLEVDKNIKKASKIWLELEVKNIKYKYIIKEN